MDIAILSKYWIWYSMAAALGIAVGIYSYRTSFPPIGRISRIFLAVLRGCMVFLIGLFLIEPVLNIYSWKTIQPELAVLFDNSKSMDLAVGKNTRLGLADSLNENILPKLKNDHAIFAFSGTENKVDRIPARTNPGGDATSIANALEMLGADNNFDNYGAVLLVTDGRQNLGQDPVAASMKLNIPVYTLTVGEKIEESNLAVDEVIAPASAYSGDVFKVEAHVSGQGVSPQKSKAFLKLDGKIVAEKLFDVPREGRKTTVEFEPKATDPGSYNYVVSTPVLDGEKESTDNERIISINILKNRIKILLAADILDWEFKFVRQSLSGFDEFEIDAVCPIETGRFSEPGPPRNLDELRKYDLAVLVNCSPEDVRISHLNMKNYVEGGGALVYMAGIDCVSDLRAFENILPLELTKPVINEGEFLFEPSPVFKQHAAILLDDDPEASVAAWHALPPFSDIISGIRPTGEALIETKSQFSGDRSLPVLTVGQAGKGRVVAITGFPLWRSYFGSRKGNDSAIPTFWKNLARWATAKHDSKNFEIATDRDVYRLGEPVKMTGYLYDEANRPKGGALVTVSITPEGNPTAVKDAVLTQSGSGIYNGEVTSLAPGDYAFKAMALAYGDTLGKTTGKFTIEKFSLELTSAAPDYNLTRRIAEATGGKAYTADNFGDFANELKLTPFDREKHTRVKPFGMPIFLVIVLAGLCIEWGVRKRMRLP